MEYEIKCLHCKRFLGKTKSSVTVDIKCSNSGCKKLETYRIVMLSDYMKTHTHKEAK
jgi:phage FluMu protein Com